MTTKLAKGNENCGNCSIDDKVNDAPQRSRVAYLSEVAWDADYFNPDAYENLVKMLERDEDLTGILVDGAVTRLDRPEYLNELLTYWHEDEDTCRELNKTIKNRNQTGIMLDSQFRIIEQRLRELKRRVPQAGKITLSIHTEDTQYTASAIMNEKLLRAQLELGEQITKLKQKRKDQQKSLGDMEGELAGIEGVRKKGYAEKRKSLNARIPTCKTKIEGLENEIQDLFAEQKLFREKKVRPAAQFLTRKFIEELHERYRQVCDRVGIELVTHDDALKFDHMVLDYAHSRHKTWNPTKGRDKQLEKSVQGRLNDLKDIDVVLESGHFGIGYKLFQKLRDSEEEANFKNQSTYDSITSKDHVTVVMALPFEDREKIGEYCKGKRAVRMSGGKPMATRKTAATDRWHNDSVTGLTILTKDEKDMVGTEWVQYQNFQDGSVLDQPDEPVIIPASADEHICSPESNPMVLRGWTELYLHMLTEGVRWRGKQAFAKGWLNAGDIGEANSRKWQHRYHHKRAPEDVMQENLKLLAQYRPESVDDIVEMAMKMTNDAMGGSVENMSVVMEQVAEYALGIIKPTLEHSDMKWAAALTTGNHTDDAMRYLGVKALFALQQQCKGAGIPTYSVGEPDYCNTNKEDARVMFGGYSNARIFQIEDYGLDTDGGALFGPVNLVVQHDPKGSGMNGVVGAGKNAGADLAIAGHTHDNKLKLYNNGPNTFGVAYKLATLQGVAPTEKYYAGSVPRTQAAQCIVMPMPGDFTEKPVPAHYLQEVGRASIRAQAEEEMKK